MGRKMCMTDRNIMLDGMMGLVVGDALGCPVQFLSREQIKNRGLVTGMEGYAPIICRWGPGLMTAVWPFVSWQASMRKKGLT